MIDHATDGEGPGDDLGLLLGLSWMTYTDLLRRRMADAGFPDITAPDGTMFRMLHRGGLGINAIAGLLDVSKQRASQLVDSLERRGYARRERVSGDGRARIVQLTDHGRAARRCAIEIAADVAGTLKDLIGTGAYQNVAAGLRALIDHHAPDGSMLVQAASELLAEQPAADPGRRDRAPAQCEG